MYILPSKELTSNIPVFNLKEEELSPIKKGGKELVSTNQYQWNFYFL